MDDRWVAVSGVPHGGLRLVADVLGALGVDLVDAAAPPGKAGSPPSGAPGEGGAALHGGLLAVDDVEAGRRLGAWVAARGAAADGGWRAWVDPVGVHLVDAWHRALPELRWLLVYRPPWDVEATARRQGAAGAADLRAVVDAWCGHATAILDVLDAAGGRAVLVEAGGVVDDPAGLAAAVVGLGVPLAEGAGGLAARARTAVARAHDPGGLRRRALDEPVAKLLEGLPEPARHLLAELDHRAALRADAVPPPPARWAARALSGVAVRTGSSPDPGARVLVVTPCHDDGALLVDAVASVAELEDPVHHVVVDDHSVEPRTVAVLDELRRRGVDVRPNRGLGAAAARNTAIAAVDLPVVLPLDADNLLRPDAVRRSLAALDAEPDLDVAYGDACWFGDRHGRWEVGGFDLARLLRGNYIDTCAALRRTAWARVGGYDEGLPAGLSADWALWLSLAAAGCRFSHLDEVTFDYRVRPGSLGAGHADPARRRAVVEHIVGAHRDLYADHVATVVADLMAAVDVLTARRAEAEAELARLRDVLDAGSSALDARVAAAEAEAADLRERTAQAERLSLAAGRAERDLHDRLGEALDALRRAERALAAADRRSAEQAVGRQVAEAERDAALADREAVVAAARHDRDELAAIRATRTWRWLRWPRAAWSRWGRTTRTRR